MRINVHDTLRVDGTVSANSENVPSGSSGSSGGSGGSLLINTRVLTGAWTGNKCMNNCFFLVAVVVESNRK